MHMKIQMYLGSSHLELLSWTGMDNVLDVVRNTVGISLVYFCSVSSQKVVSCSQ